MSAKVLVAGSGTCALHLVKPLLARGLETVLASEADLSPAWSGLLSRQKNRSGLEILRHTRIISLSGTAGDFEVGMMKEGEKIFRGAEAVVIAEDAERRPNFDRYDLAPANTVLSVSALFEMLSRPDACRSLFPFRGQVLFLCGVFQESHPLLAKEVMAASLTLATAYGCRPVVMTGNLKVAGKGLERLYRLNKEAGTRFVKFTKTRPRIYQEPDGSVSAAYADELIPWKLETLLDVAVVEEHHLGRGSFDAELMTPEIFHLKPDVTIVDETIQPSPRLGRLSQVLDLDRDSDGFLQSDNVHRSAVLSNRKGVYVIGPSRAPQFPEADLQDAGVAILECMGVHLPPPFEWGKTAEIDKSRCSECLTCVTICPHDAISVQDRVAVKTVDCWGCGTCNTVCRSGAVHLKAAVKPETRLLELPDFESSLLPEEPIIVAFCCTHSAAKAWQLAIRLGDPLPENMICLEVPCAGSIAAHHVLAAFMNGADGVLVLGCHKGNCRSEWGPDFGDKRLQMLQRLLSFTGADSSRLRVMSLASPMSSEFAAAARQFNSHLHRIGKNQILKKRQASWFPAGILTANERFEAQRK